MLPASIVRALTIPAQARIRHAGAAAGKMRLQEKYGARTPPAASVADPVRLKPRRQLRQGDLFAA